MSNRGKLSGVNGDSRNVAVRNLSFSIAKVHGSNLDSETCYNFWGLTWFSSAPPTKCRNSTSNLPRTFQSTSFTIHQLLCSYRPTTETSALSCWQHRYVKLPYGTVCLVIWGSDQAYYYYYYYYISICPLHHTSSRWSVKLVENR
jgi:hypothetical protein